MFNLNVHINPEAFTKLAANRTSLLIQHLYEKEDKTFEIEVNEHTYQIRYEITSFGDIQLYIQNEEQDETLLIIPTLNLNIGEWLLPNSTSLDTQGYNEDTHNSLCKELGTQELSPQIRANIYKAIIKTGFLNIINI